MSTASLTLPQAPQFNAPSSDAFEPQEQALGEQRSCGSVEESPSGRVYRGRSIAELIPRIQAELGPEAIVLRRRNGLEGGLGGFFQRPFIEIEARSGSRVDVYDGDQEMPPAPEPALLASDPTLLAPSPTSEPAVLGSESAVPTSEPQSDFARQPALGAFAQALSAAGIAAADTRTAPAFGGLGPIAPEPTSAAPALPAQEPALATPAPGLPTPIALAGWAPMPVAASAPASTPAPLSTDALSPAGKARSKTQLALIEELVATGIDSSFAEELVDAAAVHVLAFNPRIGLRKAVKIELERRIPTAPPLPVKGGAVALVGAGGSGKTRCLALLATTYRRSGTLKACCASILHEGQDGLKMLLSPHITTPAHAGSAKALRAFALARAEGLALIDTFSLSPAEKGSVRVLAELLGKMTPDRVVVTLPATSSARACKQILEALAPLKPSAIAITHADETDQLGVAVQAACESGLAPEYLLTGGRQALTRLDPATLAQRLLR